MSKRAKRRQKRSSPALTWLTGGGVLLIIVAVWLALGNNNGGDGTPVLQVDREVIDYGDVKLGTNLTFEITVTNVGDGTLRFKEKPYIQVLEGC